MTPGSAPQPEFNSLKEATQMKREMCPSVEALEAKALLSQVGVGMGAMRHQVADLTNLIGLKGNLEVHADDDWGIVLTPRKLE
jgi:hypothetical protein